MSRRVHILYFARLREALQLGKEEMELPEAVADVGELMALLAARGGVWKDEFGGGRQIRAAVNQELVAGNAAIKAGDEVAFFPPVTGG